MELDSRVTLHKEPANQKYQHGALREWRQTSMYSATEIRALLVIAAGTS